jgi:hypothetical protein
MAQAVERPSTIKLSIDSFTETCVAHKGKLHYLQVLETFSLISVLNLALLMNNCS